MLITSSCFLASSVILRSKVEGLTTTKRLGVQSLRMEISAFNQYWVFIDQQTLFQLWQCHPSFKISYTTVCCTSTACTIPWLNYSCICCTVDCSWKGHCTILYTTSLICWNTVLYFAFTVECDMYSVPTLYAHSEDLSGSSQKLPTYTLCLSCVDILLATIESILRPTVKFFCIAFQVLTQFHLSVQALTKWIFKFH